MIRQIPRRSRAAVTAGAAVALTASLLAAPSAADETSAEEPAFTLTVLHNNDGESQLLGIDGDTDGDGTIDPDEERAYGGIDRFVNVTYRERYEALRAQEREGWADERGVVLLNSGDNFLAGPEFAASLEKGVPFYDAIGLRFAMYDAFAVGNHEFDFGPDVLAQFIRSFRGRGGAPFVTANLDVSGEPQLAALTRTGELVKSTVVRENGERIGIIGLTTPSLPTISSPRDVEVLTDLAGIANAQVDVLQSRGVNKIILMSHLQDINEERALVPQLRGVDVVIGGGGGELLANEDDLLLPGDEPEHPYPLVETDSEGNEVPIVTTSGDYAYLGKLVVHFDEAGEVLGYDDERSGAVRVAGVPLPFSVGRFQPVNRLVVQPVQEYVAELDATVVASSEVALNGVRDDVRTQETNLGNLLADALVWAGTQQADEYGVPVPQVGIQNGGGIRNDSVIPAGDVTALDTFDIAPFGNFVSVLPEVPRETLKALLERGVSGLPGSAGQFTQVSGLSFTYDVTRQAQVVEVDTGVILTPGERVVDVVLDDGTVIVEDGEVVPGDPIAVATNDFSARGGDAYPLAGLDFTPVGLTYQQALQGYLEDALGGQVTDEAYPEGGEGRITPTGATTP